MRVTVEETPLPGVQIVSPELFEDHRGFFTELLRRDVWRESGLPDSFVQVNLSRSSRGVIRGLHFQWEPPMGKLMRVAHGTAFLVAVDLRKGSPTLGRWYGAEFDDSRPRMLWAPASFARGFCVLSDVADIEYFTTGTYNAPADTGIRWNDPAIGIEWPAKTPILSAKDRSAQTLAQWLARPESDAFRYERGALGRTS
jgi:dTDP-4-dehydrorhamnose 3,5-epimerase